MNAIDINNAIHENVKSIHESLIDIDSLIDCFERYNDKSYYMGGGGGKGGGASAGSTTCCATGTCDNISV